MDSQHDEAGIWADETFGDANLGDARRTRRLVELAACAARTPHGTITGVCPKGAERLGAFRFLENRAVDSAHVGEAVFRATARLCIEQPYVYVALDGSSLTLSDQAKKRELGRVGSSLKRARGLLVMSALALDVDGTPVGLLDQQWWARTAPSYPKKKNEKCSRRSFEQKETRHWVDSLAALEQRLATHAPGVKPWVQCDRGADCWPVLRRAASDAVWLTIRATHNRRLISEPGRCDYLVQELQRQNILGFYEVFVAAGVERPARFASMAVRACTVTLELRVARKRRERVTLQAVLAEEINVERRDGLRWLLLTNHPVDTLADTLAVVQGYTLRWRVEEFHRAWKSGVCNVEATQLQSRQALLKWATILAAVAARAVRLAYLVRTTPELPADQEFTDDEINAAFLLNKRKRDRRKRVPLRLMIELIGELGGFAHKYEGRQPGAQILARGMLRIAAVAEALKNMREM